MAQTLTHLVGASMFERWPARTLTMCRYRGDEVVGPAKRRVEAHDGRSINDLDQPSIVGDETIGGQRGDCRSPVDLNDDDTGALGLGGEIYPDVTTNEDRM
jgi:hypothetical protein